MDGILSRASRRGKQLQELLVTAIAGMKEWWRQNPLGGYDPAYTMKIRSGCEGGGKGPLVQNDLSATLATHQDQTVFAPKVCGFIYKQGAKAGNIGAGEVAPTMKTDQPPAAAYANGAETVARTLTARADGSPMLDRGTNVILQKGSADEQ